MEFFYPRFRFLLILFFAYMVMCKKGYQNITQMKDRSNKNSSQPNSQYAPINNKEILPTRFPVEIHVRDESIEDEKIISLDAKFDNDYDVVEYALCSVETPDLCDPSRKNPKKSEKIRARPGRRSSFFFKR